MCKPGLFGVMVATIYKHASYYSTQRPYSHDSCSCGKNEM